MQRAAGRNDLNGWVVAALFVLFLMSVAVYQVALQEFPAVEAAADARGIPLPADPHHTAPILTR